MQIAPRIFFDHSRHKLQVRNLKATRSMQVDSELNIAHEWASVTQALRRRLWDMHTGGMGAQDDPGKAFKEWEYIMKENKRRQNDKWAGTPYAPLVEFYYGKATLKDID